MWLIVLFFKLQMHLPGTICNIRRTEGSYTDIGQKHQFAVKVNPLHPLGYFHYGVTVAWNQPCDAVCACLSRFVQNIIASDCLCFYWIRLTLLMRKAINKQTMLALDETVKLLSQFQRWFVHCTHTVWCIYSILGMDFAIWVIHSKDTTHEMKWWYYTWNDFWSL